MQRYFITRNKDLSKPVHAFSAADDAAAIRVASRYADGVDVDLWEGVQRHVATFEGKRKPAPADSKPMVSTK